MNQVIYFLVITLTLSAIFLIALGSRWWILYGLLALAVVIGVALHKASRQLDDTIARTEHDQKETQK